MTNLQPPRNALALLLRFVPDDDPFVGDLLEEYEARRSRLWFWRQVLYAIALGARRRPPRSNDARPLKLAESSSQLDSVRAGIALPDLPRRINLSASPHPAIGGVGLVAIGIFVSIVSPQLWWVALGAIAAGILLGVALVLVRRAHVLAGKEGPNQGSASILRP